MQYIFSKPTTCCVEVICKICTNWMPGWNDSVSAHSFNWQQKAAKPTVQYLSNQQTDILMEQPDISTPKGRRDLAMILLLYDSAARVQELCDLRICDIRIDSLPVVHLLGRGEKVEMFRLPNRVHRYCANTFVRTILIYQNAAMTSCLQIRKEKVDSQRCFLRASKIYPQSKYCGGFIFSADYTALSPAF